MVAHFFSIFSIFLDLTGRGMLLGWLVKLGSRVTHMGTLILLKKTLNFFERKYNGESARWGKEFGD